MNLRPVGLPRLLLFSECRLDDGPVYANTRLPAGTASVERLVLQGASAQTVVYLEIDNVIVLDNVPWWALQLRPEPLIPAGARPPSPMQVKARLTGTGTVLMGLWATIMFDGF